jgi:hypothetical protein
MTGSLTGQPVMGQFGIVSQRAASSSFVFMLLAFCGLTRRCASFVRVCRQQVKRCLGCVSVEICLHLPVFYMYVRAFHVFDINEYSFFPGPRRRSISINPRKLYSRLCGTNNGQQESLHRRVGKCLQSKSTKRQDIVTTIFVDLLEYGVIEKSKEQVQQVPIGFTDYSRNTS